MDGIYMRKKTYLLLVILLVSSLVFCSCAAKESSSEEPKAPAGTDVSPAEVIDNEEKEMKMYIGDREVPVIWEDNSSVEELKSLCPLTVEMSMYGGFEQVGPIGKSIARDDRQTTTKAGDIVLYSGSQIVVFYGSNSWSYTRLGHVDLSGAEMAELLGSGDVTIRIE